MTENTLWIVGKVIAQSSKDLHGYVDSEWDFHGVFDCESKAVNACHNETYFIGPTELNKAWSKEKVEWVGAYYPVSKKGVPRETS